MSNKRLTLTEEGGVATVTLNRPDVHNAFDETLISEVATVFTRLGTQTDVRVIVLAGEGKSFCAGADLDWMGQMVGYSQAENLADSRMLRRMFEAIDSCPKATICRVHGAAIGGGVGLVAACDIAIAAPEARFGFSEVKLGLIPAVISPFVVRKIGIGYARALFVTGERFDAETALRIGLVQRLAPMEQLDAVVDNVVSEVLRNGPEAIAAAKTLLRDIEAKSSAEVADLTVERIAALRISAEGQEGIRAFLGKRPPGYSRR